MPVFKEKKGRETPPKKGRFYDQKDDTLIGLFSLA
jgi:hypothetical protein